MTNSEKGNLGAVLVGAGLALWLFFGAAAGFAVTGDDDLNRASTWVGFAAVLVCIGIGLALTVQYGRSKSMGRPQEK